MSDNAFIALAAGPPSPLHSAPTTSMLQQRGRLAVVARSRARRHRALDGKLLEVRHHRLDGRALPRCACAALCRLVHRMVKFTTARHTIQVIPIWHRDCWTPRAMWPRLLALAAIVGCSSSSASSSPGDVNGTIRGNAYPVADAISATVVQGFGTAGFIVMSNSTDLCAPPDTRIVHPGEQFFQIDLVDDKAPTGVAPTAPGIYTAFKQGGQEPPPTGQPPVSKGATLFTGILDAQCAGDANAQAAAVSGSVTLTAVGGGVYAGTFDVTLDSGDHITGSFNPTMCDQLQADIGSGIIPSCKP